MKNVRIFIFASLLITGPAFGEGGSHIGNLIGIGGPYSAYIAKDAAVVRKGEVLYDQRTGEAILKVSSVDRAKFLGARDVAIARLGDVRAYEFLPKKGDQTTRTRWMLCPTETSSTCVLLTPLSDSSSLVPAIIGTLTKVVLPTSDQN